ncbi:ATP-binding cassette domain-containing protein [Leeia sp. TBRC 13508]|uniref:ATP-binding cassette domain-containing protein n=1 Tax=Leeia speluncae TaxID=2884804 RepID=A0ABS8D5A3_9NEIS|nr:ATP-binding cassette domain-containing protein [Leeia speluncae]MCB6183146.1 ATP-binding cassette domain-containing protein [Leeia speluncae]
MLKVQFKKTLRSGKESFTLSAAFQTSADRIVLFGASGAGKSQTLRAIAGLTKPDEGCIQFKEQTWFDHSNFIDLAPPKRKVGFLFQDYALFPHLTVSQNIAFGLTKTSVNPSKKTILPEVATWLDRLNITNLAHLLPSALSGGQRQRVALARTLITSPQLLLLDEPFAAVDAGLRQQMRQVISELQQSLNIPLIMITHDPEDRDYFGERIIHCEQGYIHG